MDYKKLYEEQVEENKRDRLTLTNMVGPMMVIAVVGNLIRLYVIKENIVSTISMTLMMATGLFYLVYGLLYKHHKVNGKFLIIK